MQLDMFPSPDSTPNPIDLAAIARGVFQYGVTDALKVLRNVGALHSESQRQWCQQELA